MRLRKSWRLVAPPLMLACIVLPALPASAQTQPYGPGPTIAPATILPATTTTVAVSASGVAPAGGLAVTGTDAALATAAGAGIIGVGGIFVLLSRKRRQEGSEVSTGV